MRVTSAAADLARFKFMAERGRSQWDVNGGEVALLASQSLLRRLPSGVARSDFVPKEWLDYATAGYVNCFCIGYNTEQNSGIPGSWKDLSTWPNFPGVVGCRAPILVRRSLRRLFMELFFLPSRDHKWNIPTESGPIQREHVT